MGEVAFVLPVEQAELVVAQHDAGIAGLGRPLEQGDRLTDVFVHEQIGRDIDPTVLEVHLRRRGRS